ncbi:MAG: M48 family metalloprotease [Pseudomonadota bacterium]
MRRIVLVAAFAALAACAQQQSGTAPSTASTGAERAQAPQTVQRRPASEQKIGDENHPKIVKKYGGVYENAKLGNYVDGLGRKLAAVSEQPLDKWTFTVLDSPTVNAFALPGGYVYITRGLAALANSEAELAGVVGHEIGHVTAGHSALRQDRNLIATGALLGAQILGAIAGVSPDILRAGTQLGSVVAGGVLASYSRSDELDADALGIRYIARAGYDPYAQADFLESMTASATLDARLAGKSYNPNETDFFASHPATGPRTRQAVDTARASGQQMPVGANRNRDRFLDVIEGLTFGESAAQGFVRGTSFTHPELRFAFSTPDGFRIKNAPSAVTGFGPSNSRFIMDGARNPQGSLTEYIARNWVPGISKTYPTGRVQNLQPREINGLQAASATVPLKINGKSFQALLVAIRMDDKLYRLTGLAPSGTGLLPSMDEAAQTFRKLSAREARSLRAARVEVVTVGRRDSVASLARRMNVDRLQEERFRVLNGLKSGETVRAGQRVKIIR